MTYRQFILRSVLRNKRLYSAFFFSSLFSVLVFFVYAIFAFHPALSGDNLHNSVSTGLHTAEAIIYVFAVFFVMYSLSAFLKSRKKEFGLLVMHGMTSFQLRRMVFMENVLIGLFSTAGGIGLGLVFAKAILMTAEKLLRLETALPFYWPKQAILLTFCSFMLLFCVISLFTVITVRSSNVIDLLKGSVVPKSEPRASRWLSLLAAVLLGTGYTLALVSKGTIVVMVFVPVTILVIIGTYLLFTQLSVYLLKRLKSSPSLFWRRTNMLTFTDLTYRMKDNARTFFLVSIVSTVAFTAIGTLICLGSLLIRQVEEGMPFELQYRYMSNSDQQAHRGNIETIRTYLDQHVPGYEEARVDVGMYATADIVPLSAYNAAARLLGEEEHTLQGTESFVVYNSRVLRLSKDDALAPHALNSEITLTPIFKLDNGAVPLFDPYYVITDELYAKLGAPKTQETHYLWQLPERFNLLAIGKELDELVDTSSVSLGAFNSKSYDKDALLRSYSIILFIGLFIGVVFFIAAGSFLYFRLYQDLDDDLRKFKMISKLGLTAGELTKVVSRQMLLLFFAPIAVAIVHGAVALTALSNMFMESMLTESILVLGCFLLIQVLYYLFARHYYILRIRRSLG